MRRRSLLTRSGAVPLLLAGTGPARAARAARRVRPSDPAWPSAASWDRLNHRLGGQLVRVRSPLAACRSAPQGAVCGALFRALTNPYFIRDQAGLTQTSGWVDAWTSEPSAYAVAARTAADVAAAVGFARQNNLRLVVKGGGHSYQGTSDAPDSLLIWTRRMTAITHHDAFVARGCAGRQAPLPAVSVGAGAIWMHTYDAVTTRRGRYVQGGGCATVGVAGLIQSGGFGSFSKNYGSAAAGLLEAEIVTADGTVRIANACADPELFWGIKGGGGGSLGVLTRLTLRTHALPDFFGVAFGTVRATSDAAFRRLVRRFLGFYAAALFNRHWGESVTFRPDNTLEIHMVFQGLDRGQAEAVWRPFLDWVSASPGDFSLAPAPRMVAVPARLFWDPATLEAGAPGLLVADDRAGAPPGNVLYAGDQHEAGQFIGGYASVWLPASLLGGDRQRHLADAVFASSRHWRMALHFNKGLAGAPADAIAASRNTATNPAVLDAFALAICGASTPAAFPGLAGHEPDLPRLRRGAGAVARAIAELRRLVPAPGSYLSESDFFEADWRQAFWGANYERLATAKKKYDPEGLFFVHHGVGSEQWSADGFTRVPPA
ncbi:MAG TPA: FAD-binding protein [Acetobacteraceae bacterium]|nr:FAD-binding protein [Acetobacteraceae bacterium]